MYIYLQFSMNPIDALKFDYNHFNDEMTFYLDHAIELGEIWEHALEDAITNNDPDLVDSLIECLHETDIDVIMKYVSYMQDTLEFGWMEYEDLLVFRVKLDIKFKALCKAVFGQTLKGIN